MLCRRRREKQSWRAHILILFSIPIRFRPTHATLLAQKKADYAEYYKLEKEKRDLLIYKANTERLLNLNREETKNREHQREEK